MINATKHGYGIMRLANAALNRMERGRCLYPLSGPVELVVHVTDRCSFACAMCINARVPVEWPAEGVHKPGPDFDEKRLVQLLAMWPSAKSVCFAGVGEPLLNVGLEGMVSRAHDAGLSTAIITNGSELLDNVKWLCNGSVDSVSISVNAWNGESAQVNCGIDDARFAHVEQGVAAVHKLRNVTGKPHEISLSAVLWKGRKLDAQQIVHLAAAWRIDQVCFQGLIPTSRPGFGPEAMLSETDAPWLVELARQAKEQGVNVTLPKIVKSGAPTSSCSSPWRSLYVDAAGGVSGCMRVEAPSIKNGEWTNRTVWKGAYFTALRRVHLGQSIVPDRCRFCVEVHNE